MPAAALAFSGPSPAARIVTKAAPTAATGRLRIGIVCNPKSHRNRGAEYAAGVPGATRVMIAAPRTREALADTLAEFAAARIDLLVIDGGDGTVRDVLTGAGAIWGGDWPAIAVIPSGKTNALALDLGIPAGWSINDALEAATAGRTVRRRPLEIARGDGGRPLRGFLFGAGAFVGGTDLAQHTHRAGAFNGVAVGLAVAWAIGQTLFGSDAGRWRAGERMRLRLPGCEAEERRRYMLLATTLQRLPLGIKVFGEVAGGMRVFDVDGPPRRVLTTLPAILTGRASGWLETHGYRRREAASFDLCMDAGFVLDGERFPGGSLTVRQGPLLSFVAP